MSLILMAKAMTVKVGNPLRKLVLLKLADNANDEGICFPSYQYIADVCEISKASARSHIDALIQMGFISKKPRKNKDGSSSNLYILHLEKGMPADSIGMPADSIGMPADSIGMPADSIGGMPADSTITSHSFEPVNEPKKNIQKKTALSDFEPYFEKFWTAGMRKVGKPQALKSFKSAYESYSAEYPLSFDNFTQMLVDDVVKRVNLRQFGFDKLHPTTYLNNWRWLDDYSEPDVNAGASYTQKQSGEFADNGSWAVGRSLNVEPDIIPEALR